MGVLVIIAGTSRDWTTMVGEEVGLNSNLWAFIHSHCICKTLIKPFSGFSFAILCIVFCLCVFFSYYVSDNSIRICIIWLIGFLGVLEATCVWKREFYRDIGGKGRYPFCVALELIVIGCDFLCWVVVFNKLVELMPPKFYIPLKGSNDIWVFYRNAFHSNCGYKHLVRNFALLLMRWENYHGKYMAWTRLHEQLHGN